MRQAIVGTTIAVGALLASCGGGGAKMAPRAVEQAASALGGASRTLELSADDVSRLAGQAGVGEDAIRGVAPQADSQPLWRRSMDAAQTVDALTDGQIRDVAIGVACDGVNGKLNSANDVRASLTSQIQGLTQSELESVVRATVQMWQDLYEARRSQNPEERAASVLACFTLQAVS